MSIGEEKTENNKITEMSVEMGNKSNERIYFLRVLGDPLNIL